MAEPLALSVCDRHLLVDIKTAGEEGLVLHPSQMTRAQKLESMGVVRLEFDRWPEYERQFSTFPIVAKLTEAGARVYQPVKVVG